MEVKLNNISNPTDTVFFTNVPNIFTISDSTGGTKTEVNLTFVGNLASVTSADSQWNITILGDSIENVLDASDSSNRTFVVKSSTLSTAASVARALNACPTVFSTFVVTNENNTVKLKARRNGPMVSAPNFISANIPFTYFRSTAIDGTYESSLSNSLIDLEIQDSNDERVAILEKRFIGSAVSFNLSQIFTDMAEKHTAKEFRLILSSYKDGEYSDITSIEDNHIAIGYQANQSQYFLNRPIRDIVIAANLDRGSGTVGNETNKMPLYVYGDTIPFSFYVGNDLPGTNIAIKYLDSDFSQFYNRTIIWTDEDTRNHLKDYTAELEEFYLRQAFYIDIEVASTTVRYKVIKPLQGAEDYHRILWINEYGGISFFDFTSTYTENIDIDDVTYKKNIFSFYDDEIAELELPYYKTVNNTFTVTSHLIPKEGTYIFNSIASSPYIWTTVNGRKYALLIQDLTVSETENNDVYRASMTFRLSQNQTIN